ncbi:Na+/H+ antiporter NhaC family protein [Exiguobacterium sp. AM39-5BH]|uniref:Na+/H+ antiporter NhaC family protein n=1 Tax=Exiguobacterium sp. AM39-5BH TaxID=2292355 RepID=UPI0021014BCC|nr:Na+/H+ antiporter NhaC family protein [Exiguobacterium sp. AM39-5BH]
MSDTTNFAPAVAGVKLFDHIRFMMGTTVPAFLITLVLFTILGRSGQAADTTQIAEAQAALAGRFNLSWLTLLAPILVAVLAFRRMPVLPTMLVGMFAGVLTAGFVQATGTSRTGSASCRPASNRASRMRRLRPYLTVAVSNRCSGRLVSS